MFEERKGKSSFVLKIDIHSVYILGSRGSPHIFYYFANVVSHEYHNFRDEFVKQTNQVTEKFILILIRKTSTRLRMCYLTSE